MKGILESDKRWRLFRNYYLSFTAFYVLIILFLLLNVINPILSLSKVIHVIILAFLIVAPVVYLFLISKYQGTHSDGVKNINNTVGIVSLILSVVLCIEVFFRLFAVYNTQAENPGIKFFWPDYIYYKTNSLGFLDREFLSHKNTNVYRILSIGGSYTAGAGLPRNKAYSHIIEQQLMKRLSGTQQVEVYNLGMCGATTKDEITRIINYGEKLKADMVIFTYYIELKKNKAGGSPLSLTDKSLKGLIRIGSYAAYWYAININKPKSNKNYIELLKQQYSGDSAYWSDTKNMFNGLRSFLQTKNITGIAIIFPRFNLDKIVDNQLVDSVKTALLTEGGVLAYDLQPVYYQYSTKKADFIFSSMDAHPNEYAHQIIGNYLAEVIWNQPSFRKFVEAR